MKDKQKQQVVSFKATEEISQILKELEDSGYNRSAIIRFALLDKYKNHLNENK